MGQWGPGGPAVTSHFFSKVWRLYTMDLLLFRPFVCTLRTIRVIGGLFFGSEAAAALYRGLALPYCICAYAEVSLTSWGDRICM